MSVAETIVSKITAVDPIWLLVLLLIGFALAVLLPTVRTWLVRHKDWQRSLVGAQTALQHGRYSEAEKMFLGLRKKAEEDFGPADPKVACAIRNLAMLYDLQGRHIDAEPLLHRSLAIMEKADPENIETSAVLEQLAGLCQAQGRNAAAVLIFQRSLAIRERALGPDHPHVVDVLKQMLMLYEKVGERDEAKRLEERVKQFSNGTSNETVRPVLEASPKPQGGLADGTMGLRATSAPRHWRLEMLWEEIEDLRSSPQRSRRQPLSGESRAIREGRNVR